MPSFLPPPSNAHPSMTRRALGELETVTSSRYGQQYLAESYTGWPHA